jgi:hypothetical protein
LTAARVLAADTIPLAGTWRFALDRDDAGTNEQWFAKSLPDQIQLPGCLEAQGYGDEISARTPWVLSLYDHFWFLRADYAAYTNASNVKVPFLCQPPRHYLGAAWYQRDIEIPRGWKGQRVALFLERPHWKSTVWLDGREIGSDLSLCTPHEYELGLVAAGQHGTAADADAIAPGKHHLTIRVDNRMILPYRPDAHSISDSLDDAWNGIVGKIELRATAPVWIEQVRIFPHVATKSVTIKARLGNLTGQSGSDRLKLAVTPYLVKGRTKALAETNLTVSWSTNGANVEVELPLKPNTPLWDEFNPALCRLTVTLGKKNAADIHFGLRELRAAGNQFTLNGRPVYFRGTHFGGDFPLTGYPPTDVASWKKLFQTCKDYGLNHMRFHSWCPPEAAFEAADQMGFYLHVECGMWNEFTPGGEMEKMLYAETDRIIQDYGNHPSFVLLSASNEAHGRWQQVLPLWVEHYRAADPRRLYTPDTGWVAINEPGPVSGADYLVAGRIGASRTRGESGWFGRDYGDSLDGVNVPVIAHELGQWCAYPDYDVIKEFTGFMRPGNYEIFRDSARAHGLFAANRAASTTAPSNHDFARASGRFQLACYKEEIEANLRTPGMGGFQLLDLHDYTGQGTALVGLLDALWQNKGYVTPGEFKHYCAPVVPLARLATRVFTTQDQFEVPVEAANFSAAPLTNAIAQWVVLDRSGRRFAGGTFAVQALPLGKNLPLGKVSLDLSQLPAPQQYLLDVWVSTNSAARQFPPQGRNNWNFWLYPAQISDTVPANVSVTTSFDEAAQSLAQGKNVLFMPRNADLDWSGPPLARLPIFWNALMGPTWSRMLGLWCNTNSPALTGFPSDAYCDWQWTELLRNTRAINLDRLPAALQPIVSAIDDWNRNYKLGLIFEAKVGAGKLLVCAADLNSNPSPVARQLRRSLLDYMAGERFQPRVALSAAEFERLHFDTRIMRELGATATADGQRAGELVDGDPNTFWSSADARGNGPKPPHEIQISFPQPVAMTGLVLMPRQNQREHQGDIREFMLQTSDDGTNWQETARGQLASTFDEQQIQFGQTVTARHLKLIARSGFGTDNSAALAELAVIYAGPKLAAESAGEIEYKNVRTASPDIDAGDAAKPRKSK